MTSLAYLTEDERSVLRPPEDLTVSQWAERYRVVETGGEIGPWPNDRTPYLVGPMDAFSDPTVRTIVLKKSVQSGDTAAALNMLAYAIDQDPADTIWAVPRREDIGHFQFRRFTPMVAASQRLVEHATGNLRDEKRKEHVFSRAAIYFRAATSNDLASDPCRYVFGDELDKWNRWTEDEGDPVRLLEDRTTQFWNRKVVLISTPSTRYGHIHRAWLSTDRREYWVPCPRCGHFQVLSLARIKVPEGERDAHKIRRERLAWYECVGCNAHLEDESAVRDGMVAQGVWLQEGASIERDGKVRGAFESDAALPPARRCPAQPAARSRSRVRTHRRGLPGHPSVAR